MTLLTKSAFKAKYPSTNIDGYTWGIPFSTPDGIEWYRSKNGESNGDYVQTAITAAEAHAGKILGIDKNIAIGGGAALALVAGYFIFRKKPSKRKK